ncbi:MAG TPA: hypothetical protein VK906_08520 [Egicoccus sp.]|nr:hypothetical protein [Egicoccus sp.]HSK23205.1 hypothetical protein [Egicoccus sp.]
MNARTGLLLTLVLIASGCSSFDDDPVFIEVVVAEDTDVACPGDDLCVVVTAPVDGSREGTGWCALYGPGDPDDLEPLARVDDLTMVPHAVSRWDAEVVAGHTVADLNPVCHPMVEG